MGIHEKPIPTDVTGCWLITTFIQDYIKKNHLKELTDVSFRAFDAGFVNAACCFATMKQLENQHKIYMKSINSSPRPLEFMATCLACKSLDDYIKSKGGGTLRDRAKDCYINGFLTAYYLFS
ncbi:MAG: hypothetical protein ACI9TY_000326 [Alphaproteobacteria bacterium]|jgi:hypothetical protein